MTFFNTNLPPLSRKPTNFDLQKYPGVWHIQFKIGQNTIYSNFYTKLDRACILWGLISVAIFCTAQFLPIDWKLQAIIWSVISLVGTLGMVELTRTAAKEEPFKGILICWVILMLGGLVLTDLSIFLGWVEILIRLCPLWLLLNALGYLYTGLGMRSRTFLLMGIVHFLGILILPYVGAWQFFTTGIVMGLSVLLLAEFQWDTTVACNGDPTSYNSLNSQERQFKTSSPLLIVENAGLRRDWGLGTENF